MRDWNVVVTVNEDGYRRVRRLLAPYGQIASTDYYNVMVMRVDEPAGMMEALTAEIDAAPGIMNDLSRLIPARATFAFKDAAEFEDKARAAVLAWAGELAGKRFHVRMHRRGFKGALSSPDEERFLDDALLGRLEETGSPARIGFDDPDAVIDIETVGDRAGISLWTREQLRRYPFLRVD